MAEDFLTGVGATGEMMTAGERVGLRFRAPHASPRPIIRKSRPAAAHHLSAAATHRYLDQLAHGAQFSPFGGYLRGTVVVGGNPATIQLAGSDATVSMPLAQHVAAGTVLAGGSVAAVVFDPANPSDGLIVAAY